MDYESEHVLNLANSIIGVSVLAMPYCFKQCGIILSILMLFISSVISRLACHFLLKSAIIARRKTFEVLAFHAFGALGKFIIEIGIIGFLLGTCIAFFVVMGDLGPEIIEEITGAKATSTMRTSILMALALFCVLPLGLLRNVDSLAGVSKATIGFYCCLVLKIVIESAPHFIAGEWFYKVELWRPAGILQCLPIFSISLFCQTQLFEIYQTMPNASLEKMNYIIRIAVNICTSVYIFVGMFGYIAFYKQPFAGNILLSFRPSVMTDVMKVGFVLSVAFSFPLVIFPCRASLYSLIYKRIYSVHEGSAANYIPEGKFKGLTFCIVFISLVIGVLIPNIELVLGLMGSTIGVMICVLFPVTCFICVSPKNTNERIVAQIMLCIGVLVMVLGTYANLYAIEEMHELPTEKLEMGKHDSVVIVNPINDIKKEVILQLSTNKPSLVSLDIKPDKPPDDSKKIEENKNSLKDVPLEIKETREKNDVGKPSEEKVFAAEDTKEKQGPVVEPLQPEEDNKVVAKEDVKEKQEPVVEPLQPEEDNKAVMKEETKEKQEPVVEPIVPKKEEKVEQKEEVKEKVEQQKDDVIVEVIVEQLKPDLEGKKQVVKEKTKQKQDVVPELPQLEDKKIKKKNEDIAEVNVIKQINEEPEKKAEEVDIEAIKKEDMELKAQEKESEAKKQDLIDTLQKQNEVQQKLVEQQKQLIEVIIQQQQALENEKQQKKSNQEQLEAVKQIESIAKKAIESLGVKESDVEVTSQQKDVEKPEKESVHQEEKVKDIPVGGVKETGSKNKSGINLLPIPLAVSQNLTMYGKPLDESQPESEPEKKAVHKENEINIKQVDNMNINIKHEINLNVQSPKNLVDLLKSDSNQEKENVESVKKKKTKNEEEKVDDGLQSVRRDILSDNVLPVREKRDVEKEEFDEQKVLNLMKVVSKLSNRELLGLSKINIGNVEKVFKPFAGDVKNIQAVM